MWKLEIYERKKDGSRGVLKTTSKYPTKEAAIKAQATLRNLAHGWTVGISYSGKPIGYKMNNVIIPDPVEIQC